MPAILFALISYIGWGTGDIFGTIASRKIGGYSSAFYVFVIGFVLNSLYVPFALADLHRFTPQVLLLTIILGFLTPIPLIAFYEGLRVGNAAVVGTIASSFAAVAVLLSVVFLGEKISFNQAIFIIVIFLGVILSSLNLKQSKGWNFLLDPGIPYAVLAMVLWGVYFAFIKIPIKQVGWFWPGHTSILAFPLIFMFIKIRRLKLVKLDKRTLITLLLCSLLTNIGGFSYNLAISRGLVALVAPIAGSSVTLFVVLAFLIFKDRISRQQIAGISTTLIGIVLLSISSS